MSKKITKRVLSFTTALMMMFSMFLVMPQDMAWATDGTLTGDGTETNPYEIADAADLIAFAEKVNGGETGAHGKLTANIVVNQNVLDASGNLNGDSSAFTEWTPMGDNNNPYTGTFDGQNHKISGLYINNSEIPLIGLFEVVGSNGKVQNVGVIDSYISSSVEYSYVGGIAAVNDGTISGCYNTGAVNGSDSAGGIAEQNNGTISGCYNTGAVSLLNSMSTSYVGGITCNNYGTISSCCNTGTLSGGYVGSVTYGNYGTASKISNCFYLAKSETDEFDGTTFKTADQFASGEVAYLLQQPQENQDTQVWGQKIGEDNFPQLTSENHVYTKSQYCDGSDILKDGYTTGKPSIIHKVDGSEYDENGCCKKCGGYQPAVLNSDNVY